MTEARRRLPQLIALESEPIQMAWAELDLVIRENDRLSAETKRPEPYLARAELWRRVQNYDAAIEDYRTAADVAKGHSMDVVEKAVYFQKLRRSLEERDRMPKPPYRGEPGPHFGRGMTAFYEGRYGDALAHFSDAIQLGPTNAEYWYFRGLVYHALGQENRASHDVRIGVYLEQKSLKTNGAEKDPNIGQYLVRVQGPFRHWLDEYREGHPSTRIPTR